MLEGVVLLCGFCAILMNVWNAGSWSTSGDARAAWVDGTLWIAFAKSTTAFVSVVRYFTNSQAAFCFWLVREMPTIVPLVYPLPYWSDIWSGTGNGATPKSTGLPAS